MSIDPGRSHIPRLSSWPPPPSVANHLEALWAEVDKLLPEGRLLDVGCGDGSLARLLAERAPNRRVIAIDMEPHPLWHHPRPDNLVFLLGSAQALPFEPSTFEAAIVKDVLHHVPDPESTLTHIHSKITGRTVVVEANRFNPLSYIWMVKIAKHEHFSRRRLRRIVGGPAPLTSLETHVWPQKLEGAGLLFEKVMNGSKVFAGLRNYNVAVLKRK